MLWLDPSSGYHDNDSDDLTDAARSQWLELHALNALINCDGGCLMMALTLWIGWIT
jgi:hypothetical protein